MDMDLIHFDDTIENLQSVQYQAQNQIQIHPVSKITHIYDSLSAISLREVWISEIFEYFSV